MVAMISLIGSLMEVSKRASRSKKNQSMTPKVRKRPRIRWIRPVLDRLWG